MNPGVVGALVDERYRTMAIELPTSVPANLEPRVLAIFWATRGFRVLPVHRKELDKNGKDNKAAILKAWQTNATSDIATIIGWNQWNHGARVGLLTGPDTIDVYDEDVADGKPGVETRRRLVAAGLLDPETVAIVRTPSGGRHYWGSGSEQHNGGFSEKHGADFRGKNGMVLAPGNEGYEWVANPQKDLGPIQWAEIKAFLEPPAANAQQPVVRLGRLEAPPKREFEDSGPSAAEWFNANNSVTDMLLEMGWKYAGEEGENKHYTRPGKDSGVSASVIMGHTGREIMYVFTTSMSPLEAEREYDAFQLLTELRHGGDKSAAGRAVRQQMAPPPPPVSAREVPGASLPRARLAPTESTPGAELAERSIGVLPTEFFDGCGELEHIRHEAHRKGRSATTTTLAVLARIASMADVRLRIPGFVGADASLGLYVCAVALSGAGKSSGASIAKRLVTWEESRPDGAETEYITGTPNTGPGMLENHFTLSIDEDKKPVKEQTSHNAFWSFDEGMTLIRKMRSQESPNVAEVLRSGWGGEEQSQKNANVEFRRFLPQLSYQWGFFVVIQDGLVGDLLNETEGGTAQRFIWCSTDDPGIPSWKDRDWRDKSVKSLGWVHPQMPRSALTSPEGQQPPVYIEYPEWFVEEMLEWDEQKNLHGVDPIDAHLYLNMMKAMANLALLRGRLIVNDDDIQRVKILFETTSRPTIRRLKGKLRRIDAKKAAEKAEAFVELDDAKHDALEVRVKARIVELVQKRGAMKWSDFTANIRKKQRDDLGDRYPAMFTELLAEGLIVESGRTGEGNPIYNAA